MQMPMGTVRWKPLAASKLLVSAEEAEVPEIPPTLPLPVEKLKHSAGRKLLASAVYGDLDIVELWEVST